MPRHVPIESPAGNLAYGLNKGHKTQLVNAPARIARRKGSQNSRVKFIRDVVRETVGFAPYEKRCMELLRINKDKRALKYCKKKLGTHKRGKAKREEMSNALVAMKRAADAERAASKEE